MSNIKKLELINDDPYASLQIYRTVEDFIGMAIEGDKEEKNVWITIDKDDAITVRDWLTDLIAMIWGGG
jgi:hypothetical protein